MKSGLFFLCFILLEIISFILMADLVGMWRTILLVILSMGAGFILLRSLGEQMNFAQMRAMRSGQPMPNIDFSKAYLVIVAILFLIPGFFSDILAILLLFPQVRQWCAKQFKIQAMGFQAAANDGHVTIDGECTDLDKEQMEKK